MYKRFLVIIKSNILFCVVLLSVFISLQGFRGISTFIPRSSSIDGARDIMTWINYAEVLKESEISGLLVFLPKFSRSFGASDITSYLMGNSTFHFSGSRVLGRSETDILADYFGLPSDFESSVGFSPHITETQLDASWYAVLLSREHETWCDGVYLFVQAPIVYTRWNMQIQEKIINSGTNFQPAGYMGKGTKRINREQLAPDVTIALQGRTVFGDMLDPLRYGKIDGAQSLTGLSDIELSLGWQAKFQGGSLLGLAGYLIIPTGTRPQAEFLFEPCIGNGHHWELGLTLSSYWLLFKSKDERNACAFSLYGRVGHLCSAQQKRSFDLTSGRGSRYMLLERMGNAVDDIVQIPAGSTLQQQYLGFLLPAIHATTLDCRIGIDFQAEVAVALSVMHDAWRVDVGYDFWNRSKEKLKSRAPIIEDAFAIKGDANLYGFVPITRDYLALNATQSKATLQGGQGTGNGVFQNLNADNAASAAVLNSLLIVDANALNVPVGDAGGSNQPILIKNTDIDEISALIPQAQSNKFFVQCSYAIDADSAFLPYVGGGIDIEVASKVDHVKATTSAWGVWVYASIAY